MPVTTLLAASTALTQHYDVALLDLDGVVYVGPDAVPGVPAALRRVRGEGMRLAFVTNNAARTPASVAEHLTRLEVPARPEEVITSSQAAAHYLAERLPAGSRVLVVGTTGLIEALRERSLEPVQQDGPDVAAVVQGYSPDLTWSLLAEGCVAIRRGVPWIATNLDPTVPSPRGPLPGNGSLVAALRHATGAAPVSTGKPDPTMHRESLERSGARAPIVVGDRLDTDIEGANAVGCASLLVLSGVTTARDLLAAAAPLRPSYLGRDASALLVAHPGPERSSGATRCGPWLARSGDGGLVLAHVSGGSGEADGPGSADGLDPLRALCAAAWSSEESEESEESEHRTGEAPACRGADERADEALAGFGLRTPNGA